MIPGTFVTRKTVNKDTKKAYIQIETSNLLLRKFVETGELDLSPEMLEHAYAQEAAQKYIALPPPLISDDQRKAAQVRLTQSQGDVEEFRKKDRYELDNIAKKSTPPLWSKISLFTAVINFGTPTAIPFALRDLYDDFVKSQIYQPIR